MSDGDEPPILTLVSQHHPTLLDDRQSMLQVGSSFSSFRRSLSFNLLWLKITLFIVLVYVVMTHSLLHLNPYIHPYPAETSVMVGDEVAIMLLFACRGLHSSLFLLFVLFWCS